jgi:hypothetical protein
VREICGLVTVECGITEKGEEWRCKGKAVSALNGIVILCFVSVCWAQEGRGNARVKKTTLGGALCSVLLTKYCLGD